MSTDEVRSTLEEVRSEGLKTIAAAADLAGLEEARVRVLGRKGPLSGARKSLGELDETERREIGALANEVQAALQSALDERTETFARQARAQRWERERIDVTLPGYPIEVGGVHPLTRTIWDIVDVFTGLGYRVADGPEVELSTYSFDAMGTPPEHPSRAQTDTFYIEGSKEALSLRPHTSPVQIRVMESQTPPVYVVVPGRCYRRDAEDATHLAGFAQIEGLAVDEGITMADLKGTLETFARAMFGDELDVRMRPHFFPFTEPSVEVDVQCFVCRGKGCRVCKNEGWIEILGAGMIDPFLFEWVGYDAERYSGFAFGMGVERVTALAHGVQDIRAFYDNDIRFLQSWKGVS